MMTRILLVLICLLTIQACDSQSPIEDLTDEIRQREEGNNQEDDPGNDDTEEGDPSFASEMTNAINQARSTGRNCGSDYYEAVGPLALNDKLTEAALGHTRDMVTHDYLGHQDSNGNWPWDRVQAAGYQASFSGENVAAGYRTIEAVMEGWLGSAGHCANIMNGSYQDVGVAMIEAPNTRYGIYWTQVFASPR